MVHYVAQNYTDSKVLEHAPIFILETATVSTEKEAKYRDWEKCAIFQDSLNSSIYKTINTIVIRRGKGYHQADTI